MLFSLKQWKYVCILVQIEIGGSENLSFIDKRHMLSSVQQRKLLGKNNLNENYLYLSSTISIVFASLQHVKLPIIIIKIPVTMANLSLWQIVYIYMTATSPLISQTILLPRPLSNDPRFIQCIYRYNHASKRFVEVYLLSWKPRVTVT